MNPTTAPQSSRSRVSSTDTSSTGSGIGGSGLVDAHVHGVGREAVEHAVGDGRAEALERPVGALLGHQRHGLADLAVVDGVLDPVGHRGVAFVHVEAQVDHDPLAHLALGRVDAVVRVKREAGDLDVHGRVAAQLVVVVVSSRLFFVVITGRT